MGVRFKVKSQLDHIEKGGILDDCGPSSLAAGVSWASGYTREFSAADGIQWKKKVTGQKDVDGVSDNGSSLAQLATVANAMGARARWAKSWEDVVASAQHGAAIGVWVQQPVGYPKGLEVSEWHVKWGKYWAKKDAKHLKAGYGHMTMAGWDEELGWQWACPTRSGKGKEQFAVQVTEAQLKAIADSKRVAGKDKAEPHKHCLIITWDRSKDVVAAPVAPAPAPAAPVQAPTAPAKACSSCGCIIHPAK
jgi:hypothetical protein